jgi:REP element-mobilizing transposase RayT
MAFISKDTPALYFTTVAKDRLPVFRSDAIKLITCEALNEARKSGGFLIFAYVLMPDHIHFITDSARQPSVVLRYVNGIISRRVIDYLKANHFESSLIKLQASTKQRQYKHSLWNHHNNSFSITSESVLMQKVHYIHQNSVRAGLSERAEDYRWSSIRCLNRSTLVDEPLAMDISQIRWRGGVASKN